jgi:hypothetical protein
VDFIPQDYANSAIQVNVVYRRREIQKPRQRVMTTRAICGCSFRGAPFANADRMDSPPAEHRMSLWRHATRDFEVSDKEIAARAYARYIRRQATDGSALQDWLEAERELLREKGLSSK